MDPFHTGSTELTSALAAGDLHRDIGDFGSALESYQNLLARLDRPELMVLHRIALCHEKRGRFEEALEALEPFVRSPELFTDAETMDVVRARRVLGKVAFELGRLDDAEAQARETLALLRGAVVPEAGQADNLLGGVALRRGQLDQAQVHFQRSREIFRKLGDVKFLAFAYMNLGVVYAKRCEWARAIEHHQAAYYLHATESEYADQAMTHQNLGLALKRVGRYEEAREHLERSLSIAREVGGTSRQLRALLALAQWEREEGRFDEAGKALDSLRVMTAGLGLGAMPAREACLLDLESAWLSRDLGDREAVARHLLGVRQRVDRMAARGDLMIEVELLEADLAMEGARWDAAQESIARALELAREDHDRYWECVAERFLMVHFARTGRRADAERLYGLLEERYRLCGEKPSLALLHEAWASSLGGTRVDAEAALKAQTKARDLWRRLGLPTREVRAELHAAEALAALGQRAEALAMLESVRLRAERDDAATQKLLAALTLRCRRASEAETAGGLDGERAHRRLEEVLGWEGDPRERLRAGVRTVGEAIAADGLLLLRRNDEQLEIVCTQSMARWNGRRTLTAADLRLPDEPSNDVLLFEDAPARTLLDGTAPNSALVLPLVVFGRPHLLYLERRGAGTAAFTRSDRNYATLLALEIARSLSAPPLSDAMPAAVAQKVEALLPGTAIADVITQDAKMIGILGLIHKVSDSDLTVLLQGETGTGKQLLAQAIHRASGRRERPFVTVDCAALPETILESELFGHRKGAFTGAVQDRAGLLEEADGGTVFLDEIDKAGLVVQRRFLHLLDQREIRPVGATGYRSLDLRVVCATSCPDLQAEVEAGNFLKDLYYRLNDIAIVVPSLKERPDDVRLLADCFIERFSTQLGRDLRGVTAAFYDRLLSYSWPGNVRELEKAIRRAVTLAESGGWLGPNLLPAAVLEGRGETRTGQAGTLRERLEALEAKLLLETLERNRWNKSRAAKELGLSRKGLKGKIDRFGLDRRRRRP